MDSGQEALLIGVAVVSLISFGMSLWLWITRIDHQRRIDYLYTELNSKVSDNMHELERVHRREMQDEIKALKDYLEIKSVKTEPSVRMVKKGANVK